MKKIVAFVIVMVTAAARGEPPLRIDDFEDLNLEAASGLSWIALGDWLVGGASTGAVSVVRLPAGERSLGALRLEGHVRPGGRMVGAGAWTSLRPDGLGRDVTGYRALRFRARGTPGRYLAGVRRVEAKAQANLMAPFTVGATWTDVEVPFAALAQTPPAPSPMAFAPTGVAWLGITSADDSPRDFQLEIDDVELAPEGAAAEPPPPFSFRKLRLTDPRALDRLRFATVGRDGRGDGVSPRLPDARELQLAVDPTDGRVWFRFVLYDGPPAAWFGMNVALDVDGNPDDGGAWWAQNKAFHYDRLLTAYLCRGAGYWQGLFGVADSAQAAEGRISGLSSDVRVAVDPGRHTLAIGVPREALGLAPGGKARVVGTVGSSMTFADDVPGEGAFDVVVPETPARGTISE